MDRLYALLSLLALAAIAAGAFVWSQYRAQPAIQPAAQTVPAPSAPPSTSAEAPPESPIKYPIEAAPGPTPLPALEQSDPYVKDAFAALMGSKALSFLHIDGLVRRMVATVDNLPRRIAPSRVWPVNQTPGHFSVVPGAQGLLVSPDNSLRYSPFVILVESVDTGRAVALYASLYPLFQKAYEDLGTAGYFNDRLVSVIDHLLQTPDRAGPLEVQLTEVKGPVKSTQPWTRYRLSDPELESLSAGQKMLLRTGPVNERRLKAKLADIRARLAAAAPH